MSSFTLKSAKIAKMAKGENSGLTAGLGASSRFSGIPTLKSSKRISPALNPKVITMIIILIHFRTERPICQLEAVYASAKVWSIGTRGTNDCFERVLSSFYPEAEPHQNSIRVFFFYHWFLCPTCKHSKMSINERLDCLLIFRRLKKQSWLFYNFTGPKLF